MPPLRKTTRLSKEASVCFHRMLLNPYSIVAISGLGGHAFGSFKEKGGEHMWLRDALPHDIKGEDDNPLSRVMVYGYESSLQQSDSFQNIEDLGTAFRSSLLRLVGAGTIRPVVFIAHSLGGLVVKQVGRLTKSVLLYSHKAADPHITIKVEERGSPETPSSSVWNRLFWSPT